MNNLELAKIKRQENMLAKLYNYNGETVTLETFIKRRLALGHYFETGKKPSIEYNRRKFNNMNEKEQSAYMSKVNTMVPEYKLVSPDGETFFEVKQMVYDYFKGGL